MAALRLARRLRRPVPRLALLAAGLWLHASALGSPEATLHGTVAEGRARALNASTQPMDLRIEHCGPVLRSWWREPGGTLVAADELEVDGDGGFASYRYWLPPVAETLTVRREGTRAHVELRQGDRRRAREIEVPAGVQVGPMLAIRARELAGGDRTEPLRELPYLVPDRFLVIAFDLRRLPASRATPDVKISASSRLVRQVVEPLHLEFDAAGELARLRGRALPATGEPGDKQPLVVDLEIVRRYRAPCSTARLTGAPH